jgi:hypothetical protein
MSSRKLALPKKTLARYKKLVKTANEELEGHLHSLNDYLEDISSQDATISSSVIANVQVVKEERESTKRCLKIVSDFSAQIAEIGLAPDYSKGSSEWMELYSHLQGIGSVIDNCGTGDNVQVAVSTDGRPIFIRNYADGWRNRQYSGRYDDITLRKISGDHAHTPFWVENAQDQNLDLRGSASSVPSDDEDAPTMSMIPWPAQNSEIDLDQVFSSHSGAWPSLNPHV